MWKGLSNCRKIMLSEKVRTIVTNFCEKGYRYENSSSKGFFTVWTGPCCLGLSDFQMLVLDFWKYRYMFYWTLGILCLCSTLRFYFCSGRVHLYICTGLLDLCVCTGLFDLHVCIGLIDLCLFLYWPFWFIRLHCFLG